MTLFIIILLLAILIPLSMITLYYVILALISFAAPPTDITKKHSKKNRRFAIVIPAHNEEETIPHTLDALLKLDYPQDKFTVFVVADNCSDRTAALSMDAGATVFKREDKTLLGKGYALTFAFEKILSGSNKVPAEFDGIVVLDADCTIEPHALTVFDYYFEKGKKVLQTNDVTSNPDESAMTYALSVGNFIENNLFYAPKSNADLSVFLRGTGMVFHREVLKKIPWNATSLAEDADYTLELIRNDIPITFIKEVKVASAFPATKEQLDIQRSRWAKGNMSLGKLHAITCILNGFKRKNLRLADAGFTLIALSRPLILLFCGVALLISFIFIAFSCGFIQRVLFSWSLMLTLLLIAYFSLGIYLMGLNKKRLSYLLSVPVIIFRLVMITINGLVKKTKGKWAKTPR